MRIRQRIIVAILLWVSAAAAQDGAPLSTSQSYELDPAESGFYVLVFRGGLLAGLGHNHVVSLPSIRGRVSVDPATRTLDLLLSLPVHDFVIDDPVLRAAEGRRFEDEIPGDARAGTRDNLLGPRLLDADAYPNINVRARSYRGELPDVVVEATVEVRGVEHRVDFPLSITLDTERFEASGELELRHEDIGLRPFRAALGTLRVRNEMVLRYEFAANASD